MIRVWIPDMTRKTGGENTRLKGKHDCPACDGKNSLTIVGSRAASLTAVLVAQLWTSPFNPEKKLLAFSDNVQDASHRAGFFNARTFRFNLRTAIQKVVQEHGGPAPITDLTRLFLERWEQACERPEQFVATFLPPDMEWLEEYEYLRREGVLPRDSVLPDLLRKRLDWEICSEYAHNCRIGRSLEKTGSSTIEIRKDAFDGAASAVLVRFQNEIGTLRELELELVKRFLYGFLVNLKNRGGVWHQDLLPYIQAFGAAWQLSHGGERREAIRKRMPDRLYASRADKTSLI
jgi:DEAD/DEAH box helicase domain-containing protein